MKTAIAVFLCCVYWTIQESNSFFTARGIVTVPGPTRTGARTHRFLPSTNGVLGHGSASGRRPWLQLQQQCVTPSMASDADKRARSSWVASVASAMAAVSLSVCAIAAPMAASAETNAAREPIVQALVQLSNEDSDWKTMLTDAAQAPGANMLITASLEGSDKPQLGATVPMDKLSFPVMMQLFPGNAIGGARWPGDFKAQGIYTVEVTVCGGGERKGVQCQSPPLAGAGDSVFVSQLEGVPEVADSGGMRVPATVVLYAP